MATRIPWAPRGNSYQANTEIPRLMMELGRQQAEGHLRGGENWARTIGDIGAGLAGTLQQHGERQEARKIQQAETAKVGKVEGALSKARQPDSDAGAIEASLPPELRGKFRESWARIDESEGKRKKLMAEAQAAHLDYLGDLAAEVESFSAGPDGGVSAATLALGRAKRQGVAEAEQWEQIIAKDPRQLPQMLAAAKKASPKWQKLMGEEETRKLAASREGREAAAATALAGDRVADNTRGQATLDETIRHNKAMETKAAKGAAGDPVEAGKRKSLIDAVTANPSLWDDLTPTIKGDIAADLAKGGFSGFGKRISDGTIGKISAAKVAVSMLKDLKVTLQENEQYIGPISGLQGLNPWSDAKKAQAKIDLVRQRVGKAIEEGVLRKEDETKYKEILAKLTDTPSTAMFKVETLIQDFERDMETFIEEQRSAGRRVGTPKLASPAAGRVIPPNPYKKKP